MARDPSIGMSTKALQLAFQKVHSKKLSKGPFEEHAKGLFEEHSKGPFEEHSKGPFKEDSKGPFEEHSKGPFEEDISAFEREHSKASSISLKIQKKGQDPMCLDNVTNSHSWLSNTIKVV